MIKMYYNEILKELRTNEKLTQEQLANILGINRVQYNQYENNYNTIPTKHLNSIANYFNVSIDYILGFNKNKTYDLFINDIDNIKAGQRLKEFRKENKITQLKLAQTLNTNQSVNLRMQHNNLFYHRLICMRGTRCRRVKGTK